MLTDDEKTQLAALLEGRANLAQGMQFYSALTARGIPFLMEWEEKVLELCLAADPERTDILSRYRQVLLTLGKPVPATIERRFAEITRTEEHSNDHQRSAAHYNEKTGLDDAEPEFRALVERVRAFTMTSYERMYALYKAVDYIDRAGISGDIVECGVWRGGSMMVIAHTLLARGRSDRDLYLFDTYEGLPRPDETKDVDLWGNRAIDGCHAKRARKAATGRRPAWRTCGPIFFPLATRRNGCILSKAWSSGPSLRQPRLLLPCCAWTPIGMHRPSTKWSIFSRGWPVMGC